MIEVPEVKNEKLWIYKKNIWNSYYFFPMMISFVFMVITTIAEEFVVINYIEYMWLLFLILIACILFLVAFYFA